jgi:gluconate 2-dehydrogenase gamma chain
MQRREALTTMLALAASAALPAANAERVSGGQPWTPGEVALPELPLAPPDSLAYFTQAEFDIVGAMAERLIPGDALSISGKDAGCATFIDRQLAGGYGSAATMYRLGRFIKGTPEQGTQSPLTPAQRYRQGLAALEKHCQATFGKGFAQLAGEHQDSLLSAMEQGRLDLGPSVEVKPLFEQILQNVREGFLSDPIYGGNRDMASWKMLGFPGAQYDFRDLLGRNGQKLTIVPISLVDNSL